jgi:hypothetical protein
MPVTADATTIAPPMAATSQNQPVPLSPGLPPVAGAAAGKPDGVGVAVTALTGLAVGDPAAGLGDGVGVC